MPISVQDTLPDAIFYLKDEEGLHEMSLSSWAKGRKVVLIAVPGAFTPTCSARHLPSFLDHFDALKEKGVDAIGCLAVNDAHVMKAWGDASSAGGKIDMLADPEAKVAEALGIAVVKTPVLGNTRAGRMALIAEDGVVTHMFMEEPGAYEVSSAEHVLKHL
jgi:peroxiredoxin